MQSQGDLDNEGGEGMTRIMYGRHRTEAQVIHPATAHILNARAKSWWYEYTISGKSRIDFIAFFENSTWLVECKTALSPNQDILQINRYFELYGDPHAKKMVVTDSTIYKHEIVRQYTEQNIVIMRLENDFILKSLQGYKYHSVPSIYPDHCHHNINLPPEAIEDIRQSYRPYEVTLLHLATKYGVPVSVITNILRMDNSMPEGYLQPIDEMEMI